MYFDNAATTKLSDEVKQYIIDNLDLFANPSSVYQSGLDSRKIINDTREEIKEFVNIDDDYDVIFTSSGSASNTLAVKGLTEKLDKKYILYYSPTSHKSMRLASQNVKYSRPLNVTCMGEIDEYELERTLCKSKDIPIVCIEYANSEIGTINNIKLISNVVHNHNGILIVDATAYIPYVEVFMKDEDIDILTFSAHKLHALKGVGILCKKKSIELSPIIYGSQEQGLFGGTENLLGIGVLGCSLKNYKYIYYYDHSNNNSIYVYNKLKEDIEDCFLIGHEVYSKMRIPNNLFMCFPGVDGANLVALLDLRGVQVSTGSACNNGSKEKSYTLKSLNYLNDDEIDSCIRITFTCLENKKELDKLCYEIKTCVEMLRQN